MIKIMLTYATMENLMAKMDRLDDPLAIIEIHGDALDISIEHADGIESFHSTVVPLHNKPADRN